MISLTDLDAARSAQHWAPGTGQMYLIVPISVLSAACKMTPEHVVKEAAKKKSPWTIHEQGMVTITC